MLCPRFDLFRRALDPSSAFPGSPLRPLPSRPHVPLAPLALDPLPPEALQPRPLPPLEPLEDQPIPLGALSVDLLPPRLLGPLPLVPLAVEALGDGLPAAPKRDHVAIAAPEALRRKRSSARSWIGDAIVPSEPHAAGV